ncbi:MAG: acetylornithine deacetylase [Pseudomonadota bacterium]
MDTLTQTRAMLGDLIAFPTVSSESNLDIIAYLAERLEGAGARVETIPDATGEKANLFATLGPDVAGGLVLSGHTDVVPVKDQVWASDPFEMVERDGRLFGRGSCDMKGFVAACTVMAPHFAARVTDRPVHFAFTYDEETGCFGAEALVKSLADMGIRPSLAIVGEPTSMRVIDGHKGCYEYTTHFSGLAGHGSAPDLGVNAVEFAAQFVSKIIALKDELPARVPEGSNFVPPYTTLNTGSLIGGVAHNVIPDCASVAWDMRPVQPSDAVFVKDALERLCEDDLLPAMRQVDPEATITTEVLAEVEGLLPMEENPARDLVMDLTGANGTDLVAFGTEAGLFQQAGMSVAICGPGSIEQAHKADEYLDIDQLALCLGMLERLGDRL